MDESRINFLKSKLKEKEITGQSSRRGGYQRFDIVQVFFIVLIVSIIFLSAILGFTASYIIGRFSAIEILFSVLPTSTPLANETNILVLGSDATPGIKRSDTIMVLHINPYKNCADVISIPRDTLVIIPGIGMDKINHAFAYGGAELSLQTVSKFLGIDIPYYISVNVDGLVKIVDEVGGVPINITKKMYYVDYAGGLFVDLNPGLQRLSGKKAMGYVRFRHDSEGDYGRIERQQKFIEALGSEIIESKNLLKSPTLIHDLLSYVETNLKSDEILNISSAIRSAYESKKVTMYSLVGIGTMIDGVYYMKPDDELVRSIVTKVFKSNKRH